ncbi:MAG: hypothetical protein R3E89_18120 [Thiolinea sp.]
MNSVSMELQVTADTLIPRPDTELLVEQALQHCPLGYQGRILDPAPAVGPLPWLWRGTADSQDYRY